MAEAVLDAPLTLNPQTATRLVLRSYVVEVGAGVIQIAFDLVDASGKVLESRRIVADGPAVQTYIANQSATIVARLLAKLGLTGTVT